MGYTHLRPVRHPPKTLFPNQNFFAHDTILRVIPFATVLLLRWPNGKRSGIRLRAVLTHFWTPALATGNTAFLPCTTQERKSAKVGNIGNCFASWVRAPWAVGRCFASVTI